MSVSANGFAVADETRQFQTSMVSNLDSPRSGQPFLFASPWKSNGSAIADETRQFLDFGRTTNKEKTVSLKNSNGFVMADEPGIFGLQGFGK